MDFAILGPLRVGGPAGPIELPAAKQRSLLAALLLAHREEAVAPARLIDMLWGEDPPATAAKALQVHISRLRRALAPDDRIVTRASGYAIALEPGELDLERFESLVARARAAGEPGEASALLAQALALFRGPPLADAPLLGPAAGEAGRLADLRLAVLEERIDAELAAGADAALVGELEALAAEHPYRERLHAQLMRALYRAGRQADALDAFRRVRGSLVEDLGLDPGRELQQLEAAILAHDPSLDVDEPARAPEPPPLPSPLTPLLGREAEVEAAAALLDDPAVRLVTLTGPGGIGKTRMALELATRTADRYGDGARFVPLAAIDAAVRVVPAIAQALGVVDDLAEYLASRELLLVVDNLEQVLEAAPDLAALLATAPRVTLLATSRAPLRIAGERELAVSPLAREPAVELFVTRARALGARVEPGPDVERICDRLDRLPLAIELAAARSKLLSPAAILERLERRLDLLSGGPRDAPARQQTLRAAIGWSYDLLDPPVQRLFAELGVFVGGWTLEAAEAVCGPDVLEGLSALTDHSLVTATGGRFGMLETVREYALERLAELPSGRDVRPGTRGPTPSTPTSTYSAATSAPGWIASTTTARTSARRSPSPSARVTPRPRWRCSGAGATGRRAATSPRAARSRPPRWRAATGRPSCGCARSTRRVCSPASRATSRRRASCSPSASSSPSAPARAAASRAPRSTSATSSSTPAASTRRSGSTSARSGSGATRARSRCSTWSRRTSASPTAARVATTARSSCSTTAWCSRAAPETPRTWRPRCARWAVRCCSGSATRRGRSRCSARAWRSRSSWMSVPGSWRRWRRSRRSSSRARARS